MYRITLLSCLALALVACVTESEPKADLNDFTEPPRFLKFEIDERISALQYQTEERLYQNMMRLVYIGEPAIPAVMDGLDHTSPRVRASCAYILGILRDRRTIDTLEAHLDDKVPVVRYEVATSLGIMGVKSAYHVLIEGLKDEDIRNRFKAHESLTMLTHNNFGYKHDDEPERRAAAIVRWETWYQEMEDNPL
jgi:hypothetical protein